MTSLNTAYEASVQIAFQSHGLLRPSLFSSELSETATK